ncbi:hypothetical protein M514_20333 [Trichuris suis]|uniref:Uncharacterized protein n=1 Tax=Trichuris suis TaxID=68888 RepID=A0A085NDE6_9BILA|nr:hypothetical protein M514_20333 [Trichuris suis]
MYCSPAGTGWSHSCQKANSIDHAAQKGKDPLRCLPTQPLDPFRISALPDFDPFKPSTHSVFRPIQYLDLFRVLTSRDFDQLGPTTHLESRHIQNFYLEEYEAL